MELKKIESKIIKDSRKQDTIKVIVKTNKGKFISSSPSGKSTGIGEKKPYLKSISNDIKNLEKYSGEISRLKINKFSDLKKIEGIIKNKIGANTLFALESCLLKILAKKRKKQVWEVIKRDLKISGKKFPFPVGNCIGGGKHSYNKKKPEFQEFLFIPKTSDIEKNYYLMKKLYKKLKKDLKKKRKFNGINDEGALQTSLNNEQVLEIMKNIKKRFKEKIGVGIDVAASSFYNKTYNYKSGKLSKEKQINFIFNLIKKYNLEYIEDPLREKDFNGFSKLNKKLKKTEKNLIIGDDLTVTQLKYLKKALKNKGVSGIIIKPNQVGSLIELSEVVKLAKKYNIKTVFSHRSGETMENILADLAFGFCSDYIKVSVKGKERDVKYKRLIKIKSELK